MNDYYELIKKQDGLPIKAHIQSGDRLKMHWHRDIEIALVLQGSVNIRLGNDTHRLEEDELIIINNNCIHNATQVEEDSVVLIVKINPDYYSKYYSGLNNIRFDCRVFDCGEREERLDMIRHHLAKIIWEFNKKKDGFKLMVGSEVHLLLAYLVNNCKIIPDGNERAKATNNDMERIQRVVSYIDKNADKGVTLQEVADVENLNVYYMSHFIKRVLGISFQKYLNVIRLDKSLKLLSTTNKTITEISYESGFPSTKSLNRIFKRELNCSPSEYRRDNRDMSYSRSNKGIGEIEVKQGPDIYKDTALTKLFSHLRCLETIV